MLILQNLNVAHPLHNPQFNNQIGQDTTFMISGFYSEKPNRNILT